jgi:UDP-N-acetylmuramoylalanine--D-glutamate ligase
MNAEALRGSFQGKKVLVMGLGRFGGGVGVSRFLVGEGAQVTVTDTAGPAKLEASLAALQGLPVTFRLGEHREEDFAAADVVIVNPAVHRDHPCLQVARSQGVSLTAEMNLFLARCAAPVVAITGSNGKSTTTAMTAAVLRAGAHGQAARLYRQVWLGGNIGQENLLGRLHEITTNDLVVLELSSFQLYDLTDLVFSPHIGVVTNIAPNHLDWHGTMQAYVEAKQNVMRFQGPRDHAVLNRLDPPLKTWTGLGQGQLSWYPADGVLPIKLQVPGDHNQQNAAAALEVARILGVPQELAREALTQYRALPHRLELVRELDGVRFYNDSIATTPESVIAAIDSFAEAKVLILGGYDKKISFAELADRVVGQVEEPAVPPTRRNGTVAAAVLIGQVRDQLAQEIERVKAQRQLSLPVLSRAETFAEAVALTRRHARPGMVVLLSPATASYDMFQNFQDRGEQFRRLVLAL